MFNSLVTLCFMMMQDRARNIAFTFFLLLITASCSLALDRYRLTVAGSHPNVLRVAADLDISSAILSMEPLGAEQFPDRWAHFVTDVSATDRSGKPVRVEYLGDAKWRLDSRVGQRVRFSYAVKLDHERHTWPGGIDGVAFAREWGVFYTGRTFLVFSDRGRKTPIDIDFEVPNSWKVTAPWVRRSRNGFRARDAEDLAESMFFAGTHREFTATRNGFRLIFALGGPGIAEKEADYRRLAAGVLDRYIDLMGGIPNPPPRRKFARSVVIINRNKDLDGEVIGNHISMVLDPTGRQNEVFSNFIFAHEFFHLWNGKSINVNSTREDWFKEGVTSYYTLKALVEIGAISRKESLAVLSDLFYKRYAADPSLGKESMRDVASSGKKDKHWGLIYGGGIFAGICQDVAIRKATANRKSLDDLMREFFRRYGGTDGSYKTEDVQRATSRLSGTDQSLFFKKYIFGVEQLPVEQCLTEAGLNARIENGILQISERSDLDQTGSTMLNSILGLDKR